MIKKGSHSERAAASNNNNPNSSLVKDPKL